MNKNLTLGSGLSELGSADLEVFTFIGKDSCLCYLHSHGILFPFLRGELRKDDPTPLVRGLFSIESGPLVTIEVAERERQVVFQPFI
ncbi:MAG: hypothetical protein WC095_02560 [Candidatus Paceibacterota bacterium]